MTLEITRDNYKWEKLEQVFNDCVKQYEKNFSSYKPYALKEIYEYNRFDGAASYTFKCEIPRILAIRITDYLLEQYGRLDIYFEQNDVCLFVAKEVDVGEKALLEI